VVIAFIPTQHRREGPARYGTETRPKLIDSVSKKLFLVLFVVSLLGIDLAGTARGTGSFLESFLGDSVSLIEDRRK
jgi:hypothetical protein